MLLNCVLVCVGACVYVFKALPHYGHKIKQATLITKVDVDIKHKVVLAAG